jgi:hypothetical protein
MEEEEKTEQPIQPPQAAPAEEMPVPEAGEQQPTPNKPTPLTQDMEVHHHTHAAHGKKNWKSYFWEFLMLFLAVFCGFLAEYQLEHKIEKQRENKLMRLLVQDLQSDIDSIAKIKIHREERYLQSDSLRKQLINGEYKSNGADFYFWGRNITRRRFFYSADGTIQQLKNAGNLRLIHNQEISKKIIAYDITYRNYLRQLEVEMGLIDDYRNFAVKFFDAQYFQTISIANIDKRLTGNPQPFDTSPSTVNELANRVNYVTGGHYRMTLLLDELSDKATELLVLLKKEYKIK